MTREERAREALAKHHNGELLFYVAPDAMPSWAIRAMLAFADAEAAAMRERAADVPRQVSGIIGAHYGSSIDSALMEVEAAIRALPATGEVGRG